MIAPGTLGHDRRLIAKAARFATVGVLCGIIYAATTALLVSGFGMAPTPASIAGYCASAPVGFAGHRQFSFRSQGRPALDGLRFVIAQALNILVTAGSMQAATVWLGSAYWWGMLAAVVLVPTANFAAMNLWVFRHQHDRMEAPR